LVAVALFPEVPPEVALPEVGFGGIGDEALVFVPPFRVVKATMTTRKTSTAIATTPLPGPRCLWRAECFGAWTHDLLDGFEGISNMKYNKFQPLMYVTVPSGDAHRKTWLLAPVPSNCL